MVVSAQKADQTKDLGNELVSRPTNGMYSLAAVVGIMLNSHLDSELDSHLNSCAALSIAPAGSQKAFHFSNHSKAHFFDQFVAQVFCSEQTFPAQIE